MQNLQCKDTQLICYTGKKQIKKTNFYPQLAATFVLLKTAYYDQIYPQ